MVISVASQKGGTGKTSTSISLAAGLAHRGKRVLLIDIDSQANSSKVLLHEYPKISKEQTIYATILTRAPLVIHQTHVPNLSLVPSHILLSNTDIELTTAKDHRESRLKTELDKIKSSYDYVFIDNPPALGWLTLNAFTASDRVLLRDAHFNKTDIYTFNPRAKAALAYDKLIREVFLPELAAAEAPTQTHEETA